MLPKRRSRLEQRFEEILRDNDVKYKYEVTKISYIIPESSHTYTVDWTIDKKLLIETKGYLSDYSERRKYVLLKEQHPDLDLRFVFDNPNKLCGGTKMTHAKWAEKYEFTYCSIKDTETILKWVQES
jgi:hypothetical protein